MKTKLLASSVMSIVLVTACGSSNQDDSSDDVQIDESSASDSTVAEPEVPDTEPVDSAPASGDGTDDRSAADELFPDVLGAAATRQSDGSWTFEATISSPYDSPERYADAWRVLGPDGTVYGIRELGHDHANEQPFTRSQNGIEIPEGVEVVTVEGRDQESGWGGDTVEVQLDG